MNSLEFDTLNVTVKSEGDSLLMCSTEDYKEQKFVTVFSFEEGHNHAVREYYQTLKSVPEAKAKEFISKVQAYYNSVPDINLKLVLKQRLSFK